MVAQLCKYTKNYWTVNFKRVNFMACKLYLNMAVKNCFKISMCASYLYHGECNSDGKGVSSPPFSHTACTLFICLLEKASLTTSRGSSNDSFILSAPNHKPLWGQKKNIFKFRENERYFRFILTYPHQKDWKVDMSIHLFKTNPHRSSYTSQLFNYIVFAITQEYLDYNRIEYDVWPNTSVLFPYKLLLKQSMKSSRRTKS